MGSAVDDVQWAQSSLPIRIGGLGMSDLSLVSLAAFTSSVLRAWQFWSGFGYRDLRAREYLISLSELTVLLGHTSAV